MKGEMKRQDKEEGEKYRWIDKMKGEKERMEGGPEGKQERQVRVCKKKYKQRRT